MGEYLLSYSNQDKTVKVWNYGTGTECSSFELPAYYDVSSIMHPDTYLNKILIGTKQGPLYLWNFRFAFNRPFLILLKNEEANSHIRRLGICGYDCCPIPGS